MYNYADIQTARATESEQRFVKNLLKSGVSKETIVASLPNATRVSLSGVSTESFSLESHTDAVINSILSYNGLQIAKEGIVDKIKSIFGFKPKATAFPKKLYDELYPLFPKLLKNLEDALRVPFPDHTNIKAVKTATKQLMAFYKSDIEQDSASTRVYQIEQSHPKVTLEESGWTKEAAEKAKADLAHVYPKLTALTEKLEPRISKAWGIVDNDDPEELDDDVYHFFRTYADNGVGDSVWWAVRAYELCAESAEFGLKSKA